jgi:hypothetical protein
MEHKSEETTLEEFDNRPIKRSKTLESRVMDDQFPSPSISPTSLISECSESIGLEINDQENGVLINSIVYDYLPQGKISTYYFFFCYL